MIEITNPNFTYQVGFETMARTFGMEFHRFLGEPHEQMETPSTLLADMLINPAQLREFLTTLNLQPSSLKPYPTS